MVHLRPRHMDPPTSVPFRSTIGGELRAHPTLSIVSPLGVKIGIDEVTTEPSRYAVAVNELNSGVAGMREAVGTLIQWKNVMLDHALPVSVKTPIALATSQLIRYTEQVSVAGREILDSYRYFEQPWVVRDAEMAAIRAELSRRTLNGLAAQHDLEVARELFKQMRSQTATAMWGRMARWLLDRRRAAVRIKALQRRIHGLRSRGGAATRSQTVLPTLAPLKLPSSASTPPPHSASPRVSSWQTADTKSHQERRMQYIAKTPRHSPRVQKLICNYLIQRREDTPLCHAQQTPLQRMDV